VSRRTVRSVMTSPAITVDVDTTYKRIAELLAEHRISTLPVLNQTNDMVGVVSEADLIAKPEVYDQPDPPEAAHFGRARALRRKADASCAHDLMSSPAIYVPATATVAEAARLMDRDDLRMLPVLDETGQLVGVLTRRDILRLFLREDAELRADIIRDVFEDGLWIDTGTVQVEVVDGKVTLRGTVSDPLHVRMAGVMTAAQDGVVSVDNLLTAVPVHR
jgi:CBS domain-containing protein